VAAGRHSVPAAAVLVAVVVERAVAVEVEGAASVVFVKLVSMVIASGLGEWQCDTIYDTSGGRMNSTCPFESGWLSLVLNFNTNIAMSVATRRISEDADIRSRSVHLDRRERTII
jgi:hypothetical protein